MFEQLLGLVGAKIKPQPKRILYLDSVLGKESVQNIAIAFTGNASYNNSYQLDGRNTFSFPQNNANSENATAQLNTPLDMRAMDFTVEYTTLYGTATAVAYINEFNIYNNSGGQALFMRWRDDGRLWLEPLGVTGKALNITKAEVNSKEVKWTVIGIENRLYVYRNGKALYFLDGSPYMTYDRTKLYPLHGVTLGGWGAGGASNVSRYTSSFEVLDGVRLPTVTSKSAIFMFDPVVGKDIINDNCTFSSSGGYTPNASRLLNGKGVAEYLNTSSAGLVTFKSAINLNTSDWTIEYDAQVDSFAGNTQYQNDLYFNTSVASNYLFSVWGNSGEGGTKQFFMGSHTGGNYDNTWQYGLVRDQYVGQVIRTAIVKRGSVVNVYRNGVRQTAHNKLTGNTGITTTEDIPSRTIGNLTSLQLGYINASWPSYVGAMGRIAIYDYAKYEGSNYSVNPIE